MITLSAKGGVLAAIFAVITVTILRSFLVFYMLRRSLGRRRNAQDIHPSVFPEMKRQGPPLDSIVDDNGLDVLYWRKIHGNHKSDKTSHRERLRPDGSLSPSSGSYDDGKTEVEMLPMPAFAGKAPAVTPASTVNPTWEAPRVPNPAAPQRPQMVPVHNMNPSPPRYSNSIASTRTSLATKIKTWGSGADSQRGTNSTPPPPPQSVASPPRPPQSILFTSSNMKPEKGEGSTLPPRSTQLDPPEAAPPPPPPQSASSPPFSPPPMMYGSSAQKTQTVQQPPAPQPGARPPLRPPPMMYVNPALINQQKNANYTPERSPPSSSSSIAARPPPTSSHSEARRPLPPPPMRYVNSAPKSQKDVHSIPTSTPPPIQRPDPPSAPMPPPQQSPVPQSSARPPPPPPPPRPVTAASQPPTPPPPPPPPVTKKPITGPQIPPPPGKEDPPVPPPVPGKAPPPPPAPGKAPPPPPAPGKAPPPPGRAPPPPRVGPLPKAPPATKAKGEQNPAASLSEPMPKLKPLHWDKVAIPANSDHSMVWGKLRQGSFSFDYDQMEALFGLGDPNTKNPQPAPSKPDPPANRATNQVFLLDPHRSQNIAIVLRSIGLPRESIVDSLLHGRELAADVLEKLVRIAPTLEDMSAIRAYPSDSVAQLADAESFLYGLLKVVPTAFRRVDAMIFRSTYDSEIHVLKENLQTLELACKELKSCTLFFKLLEVVLKAGNQMNAGTERGNAQAFNLRTLSKLADVKSTDGKTTLLYFVVQEMVRDEGKKRAITRDQGSQQPDSSCDQTTPSKEAIDQQYLTLGLPVVGRLNTELANVKKAAGVEYEFVASCCSKLGVKVGEIKKFVSGLTNDEFKEDMDAFVAGAEKELKVLREDQEMVTDLVKKTIQFYHAGAARDRPENLLQLFVIVRDFLNLVDHVCVEISKSLQRRKAQAGSAGPSTAVVAPAVSPMFANLPAHFVTENSRGSSDSDDEF